jgi:hypothetical protein
MAERLTPADDPTWQLGSLTQRLLYESTKENLADGSWRPSSIILRPDSNLPGYEPIVLSEEQAEDLRIIGELVAVLG